MTVPKPRRWFVPRYSLRTLLIVMTVACLVSGFWLNKAFRQRDAVRRFYELTANRPLTFGDLVTVGYNSGGETDYTSPATPAWLYPLRGVLGDEAFGDVIAVNLSNTQATDDDLRHLASVSTVERIWLSHTKVTDRGLPHLHACPRLQLVMLNNLPITDDGLAHLAELTELESIFLNGTKITDAGLEHLGKLPRLKEVWLQDTRITDAGYRKLQAALPDCAIQADGSAYEKIELMNGGHDY